MAATQPQPFASASLYVGDLHPDVTESMLYEIFNAVGPVASIRVCRDNVTRRSLGYAYVNYHASADAERALDTLNYSSIKDTPCRIMWSHRDPSLRKSAVGNIFVKNLDKNIDNKALYDTFSLFGNILSCKVATDEQGRSLGFGFVHYETEEAAKTAIERVNNMMIGNKTVFVGPFQKKNERSSNKEDRFTNLYIKSFPEEWTEEILNKLFAEFGSVTSTMIMKDKKGRPFGFVNFENAESAKKAVDELNDRQTTPEGVRDRADEDLKKEGEDKEGEDKDGEKKEAEASRRLYVSRAQTKAERQALLRNKFDNTDRQPKYQGVNLYIKNLDDTIDDQKLREEFEKFGTINSCKVMRDERSVSRGFGFVCFLEPDAATKAVTEMHLKLMNGKPLYVGLAERREVRMQRLQLRYRMPQMPVQMGMGMGMVPRVGGSMMGPQAGGPVGPGGQQLFPGAAPNMYFSPGMQPPRPMMLNMSSWRGPQGPRPYGGPVGPMGMAGVGMGAMAMAGGPQGPMGMRPGGMPGFLPMGAGPMVSTGAQNMMGIFPGGPNAAGGMANRGARGVRGPQGGRGPNNYQGGAGPQQGMNMMGGPMGNQAGKQATFKFTDQARNQRGVESTNKQVQMVQQSTQPAAGVDANPSQALTASTLAAAPAAMQKQMLGEHLFPKIAAYQPELAGKITGMMLEMDNSELLILLESDTQLKAKVEEALRVLQQAQRAAQPDHE